MIDLDKYPIDRRHSNEYKNFVVHCRKEFQSTGCLYLPDFLTSQSRSTILDEINSILNDRSTNLFQSIERHIDDLYSTNSTIDRTNEIESSSKTIIAFDQIPIDSLLRRIYSFESLTNFLRDVIESFAQLYPSCDELGALYVNIYRQSNRLSWHTDHSQFFVNLLLQQASNEDEGIFQYKFDPQGEIVSRNDFRAGGLVLFSGRNYLHRVTEICSSSLPRINAILTYDSQPNHRLTDYVREKFFGRK